MKLCILSIGRERKGPYAALAEDYLARLSRYTPAEAVVAGDPCGEDAAARAEEAKLLRKKLGEGTRFVALDERGELLTSPGLAERLNAEARRGGRALALVLGGPSGFDPALREAAAWSLALSRLTLPHQLARVVLLEQLYRAHTILRGEPYSK